jgi:hypothetical protein
VRKRSFPISNRDKDLPKPIRLQRFWLTGRFAWWKTFPGVAGAESAGPPRRNPGHSKKGFPLGKSNLENK